MGVPYYGDFAEDDIINLPFNTFTSDDPSASVTVTDLVDTDVEIFKDGSTTEYSADAAVAVTLNFDGNTGAHMCTIDLSENAYFATGSEYSVMLVGITVDGATLNVWIGSFSIERAGGTLATAKEILTDTGTTLDALIKDVPTVAEFEARTIVSADYVITSDTIAGVTTCTTNSDLVTAAAVVNEWESQSQTDPTGFHVNVMEVNGTGQTANDNSADINEILTDTGSTLDTLIKDIPTVAEFEARSIVSADYTVVGDTIAGVTTVTNLTNAPTSGDLTATMKASVNTEADNAFATYDPPTKTELDSGFTEIKGATWASGTDTLEHIRNKQTDIEADTGDIQTQVGTAGDGLTAVVWNAAWDAEVQSECADALTAYDPPTDTEMVAAFTEIKGATWAAGTDTLEHIRNKQTDIEADTADIQTQVGTAGDGLTAVVWNAAWDAEVQSECKDALDAYDPPTDTEMLAAHTTTDALIAALNNIAASDVTAVEVDNDGTAISLDGFCKLVLSVLTGKSAGGGTANLTFRDIADSKTRVAATVDATGRTGVGTRDAA